MLATLKRPRGVTRRKAHELKKLTKAYIIRLIAETESRSLDC